MLINLDGVYFYKEQGIYLDIPDFDHTILGHYSN